MKATLAFINGNVLTMNKKKIVEAVAVCENKIIGVGTNSEIMKMTNFVTSIIDLKGRTLLPGFIDTHVHVVGFGFSFESVDLLSVPSMGELIERSRDYIKTKSVAQGTWVLGRGYDQNIFEDTIGFPTSKDLNKISEKHPILLLRTCGHIGICNDLALKIAGVDRETFVRGGAFDKDANGHPNGVIREAALEWFKKKISNSRTVTDLKRAIKKGCDALSEYGITSIHTEDSYDLGYSGNLNNLYKAYSELITEGKLNQRIYQKVSLPRQINLDLFLEQRIKSGDGNNFFRMGPVKLWADGTIGARTAYLLDDYADDGKGQRGISVYDDDEVRMMIGTCQANSLQCCIHTIGDAALDQVVKGYEGLELELCKKNRHRIVHCQIGTHEIYRRMGGMGLSINIQPLQSKTDYPLISHRLGEERTLSCHAWKSIAAYGVNITASSDVPCTNSKDAANVFCGIDAIVNREWNSNEAVTVYEGLKMYTINGALSAFEEDIKGTIEVGKLADFAVVRENPLDIDVDISNISVLETYIDGVRVYKSCNYDLV